MAYTNIDDPSEHFNTILYSGNSGNPRSLTGVGFKPDFLWVKRRNAAERHLLTNAQMGVESGAYKWLDSSDTADDFGGGYGVASFDTDGFTFKGVDATWNASSNTYVAWNWKANGGTTASNTDGSITTTTQVNSDAGFSIVTWAGGGTGTLGHGLGETPDMWIIKNRDYAVSWAVGFSDSNILGGRSKYLSLNTTGAISTYNNFWGTSDGQISSTTIGAAGDRTINISGNDYVGYFFKAKQGYSKFGKYIGNGNADGPFAYTGFKPAFLMIKNSSGGVGHWTMYDNKRAATNLNNKKLAANLAEAENDNAQLGGDAYGIDFLSNGFKIRLTGNNHNVSAATYIFMAFAENPLVTSTGVPTTAR